jgi:hypothetical protein
MTTKAFDFAPYVLKGLTYPVYIDLVKDLLSEGKTTGPNQGDDLLEYTKLNLQRMERLHKTVSLNEELVKQVEQIKTPQTWLCITEAWCGDAAQNIAVFARLSELNSNITFKLVLRDENIELIDQYLTNGGRAIPIVIAVENNKEVWKWGPRPAKAQEMIIEFKKVPDRSMEEFKTALHTWYAKNKAVDQQEELLQLIK